MLGTQVLLIHFYRKAPSKRGNTVACLGHTARAGSCSQPSLTPRQPSLEKTGGQTLGNERELRALGRCGKEGRGLGSSALSHVDLTLHHSSPGVGLLHGHTEQKLPSTVSGPALGKGKGVGGSGQLF